MKETELTMSEIAKAAAVVLDNVVKMSIVMDADLVEDDSKEKVRDKAKISIGEVAIALDMYCKKLGCGLSDCVVLAGKDFKEFMRSQNENAERQNNG
jgi:hypothetical protein